MPNHITNVVIAAPAVIAAFKNADGKPDFNCIIPQPECLRDFNPHSGIISRAKSAMGQLGKKLGDGGLSALSSALEISNAARDLETPINPEDIELVVKAVFCFQQTGYFYWYDWNINNWDTKWNAYSHDEERSNEKTLVFETAWSMPEKIALALSEKFPSEEIVWQYADEDTGSNCGTIHIVNGSITKSDVSPGWSSMDDEDKRKWTKFAFELHYPNKNPAEYGYDENFNYIEE